MVHGVWLRKEVSEEGRGGASPERPATGRESPGSSTRSGSASASPGTGWPRGGCEDQGTSSEPPSTAGPAPGPHLCNGTRQARRAPAAPRRRGGREGPRAATGWVTVTPRPLQLLIPSPSPIPEEEWAAAANATPKDKQACSQATQARCSNGRFHLGSPVLPRAWAERGGASREPRP